LDADFEIGSIAKVVTGLLYADALARPLELDCFYVPETADQLRPGALTGRSRRGRPRQPWSGEGLGPAGGIRASITSMARFTAAVLDSGASGVAALDPVAPFGAVTEPSAGTRGDMLERLRLRTLSFSSCADTALRQNPHPLPPGRRTD